MRIAGLLCLCLIGCDDGGTLADAGRSPDAGPRADGRVISEGAAPNDRGVPGDVELEVVVENGGVIIPVADGDSVPFVWGFQGGTMIQPGILLPVSAVEGLDEVRLTVRHRPDPEHPDDFRDAGDFGDVIQDLSLWPYGADRVLAGPVDLQLGRSDLGGMRLQLEISVEAQNFEIHKTIRVAISNPPTPCDDYRRSGANCQYWSLPLAMRVVAHAPAAACADAVVPMVEYRTDEPAVGPCLAWLGVVGEGGVLPLPGLEGGADRACLDAMGLGIGGAVRGLVAVRGKGTCAPVVLQPAADARGCAVCE